MDAYHGLTAYFGDLHNHCGISYGHGSLDDAMLNARQRLDFVSVTGHAFWPDMPAPTADNRHVVDFHRRGFERLQGQWDRVQEITRAHHQDGTFVTYLGFEMHSFEYGDYTVVYPGDAGEILYCDGLPALRDRLRGLAAQGTRVLAFPHHIAYKRGTRGINWDAFTEEFSPVVEIFSMHGCGEADENTRPFLHTMGPSDHDSTMQHGLDLGHVFGVLGSTDHHSAHPGSYGHGMTGVWATARTRAAIWDAIHARRTFALTGDRMALRATLNGQPMGSRVAAPGARRLEIDLVAGGAIDCVDVVRDNRLVRRFSQYEIPAAPEQETLRTKLFLELGWGPRNKRFDWEVTFGVSQGRILAVEPRFRGEEVVSPLESGSEQANSFFRSNCRQLDERRVRVETVTFGNPNNTTPATQGVCLEVEMPVDAAVLAVINGEEVEVPVARLLRGAFSGRTGAFVSPAYRFHRAPRPEEYTWSVAYDEPDPGDGGRTYYVRVRQKNDQWAWSSPFFVAPD
ncbi:MAG: DUF3604 domain-containing protein [Hyphomicrobiales bacterium]|nr:DUF3604 domain-containing protein [Hyphomicrobiales bacterium]